MTAYRDVTGPSESLICPSCHGCSGFDMRPDGALTCRDDDCGMTIGRWALRQDMVPRPAVPQQMPSREQAGGTWVP